MPISDQDKQRLQQAAALIENGNVAEAKTLLAHLKSTTSESAPMWYLVSLTVDAPDQKRQALNRALAFDPNYQPAQRALTITLTPSQTPLPAPLNLTSGSGHVEAQLFSGADDPIAQERQDFVLTGTANLFFSDDTLSINVKDEVHAPAEWNFQFFAANFQANALYENAVNYTSKAKDKPHLDIASPYGACDATTATGQFTVEQQSPTVIISFTHLCPGRLKGVLTFTLNTTATPTPVLPE